MAKKTWIAHVKVFLKDVVLDPQGKAVLGALQSLGFEEVQQVRVGRYIRLVCAGKTKVAVQKQVESACHKLLANPVIEQYTVHVE